MTKRQTRSELVRSNLELAKTSNAHVATVHLGDDMNLAFVIRAAAYFGAKSVHGNRVFTSISYLTTT